MHNKSLPTLCTPGKLLDVSKAMPSPEALIEAVRAGRLSADHPQAKKAFAQRPGEEGGGYTMASQAAQPQAAQPQAPPWRIDQPVPKPMPKPRDVAKPKLIPIGQRPSLCSQPVHHRLTGLLLCSQPFHHQRLSVQRLCLGSQW